MLALHAVGHFGLGNQRPDIRPRGAGEADEELRECSQPGCGGTMKQYQRGGGKVVWVCQKAAAHTEDLLPGS